MKRLWLSSMDTSTIGHLNLVVGQSRMHSVLKTMTLIVHESWHGRNEVLHQHKEDKDLEICSMESAELCHYHSNPKLIQSLDQHYCSNMALNILLQSQPSVCGRCLNQVKKSRAAYLKDGQNQQTINKYMMSIQQTRDTPTMQETRQLQTSTYSA